MKDAIKLSVYTHNDGTHIIVRSWNEEKKCYEYHVEWIHGVLSPDMKTVVMLYADGSRSLSDKRMAQIIDLLMVCS